jgi:hypothetical protein
MRRLRLIGYWQSPVNYNWPKVEDFVDPNWDSEERELTINYLRAGAFARRFWGVSTCRFCGAENGREELTDGEWLWPDGLAHYLAVHEVRLPHEFVAHARERYGRVREEEIDRSWWRAQRGGLNSGGGEARDRADE